ncbi:DUF1016 N-terminal domain-containing protein [Clostridium gasigenes]|uniref:DUF1016 N-terminal domain-containing protein n=1 Tax=Clostridium gasigenes TaxID=94869 RepID=UPI000B7F3FA8
MGKIISEAQGNDERSEYGSQLLIYLSEELTKEFSKGFDKSNLSRMRKFYLVFNNIDALSQ